MSMKPHIKAYIYISITILLWGSTPPISKLVLGTINSFQATFFTILFAVLGLFFILLLGGKLKIIKKYSLNDFKKMALMGFISPFLYLFLYYTAFLYITVTEVNILNYLWPIFVLLFAFFILKEKVTLGKILGILIGFSGAIIVISQGDLSFITLINPIGYLVIIFGAACYGLFSILGKKLDYEHFSSMFFYLLFGLVFIAITVGLFSSFKIPNPFELLCLIYLGVFATALGFVFWFKALKYGETAKMSNLIFLVPFIGLFFIHIIIKERISILSVFGLGIIILGFLIQKRRN